MNNIYSNWVRQTRSNSKQFCVLIDPDRSDEVALGRIVELAENNRVDYFFVGGSLLSPDKMEKCLAFLKSVTDIPAIIFPGNNLQVSPTANALLFMSLISGRNPEYLIGQQVASATYVKECGLETISTGYVLIDGGSPTSVTYMSNTSPIPKDKSEIAVSTAVAGELLGLKAIYLEAGSGAKYPVRPEMIQNVKDNISIPLIVGGGIRTPERALESCKAGADLLVVGNALEKEPNLLAEISEAVHSPIFVSV